MKYEEHLREFLGGSIDAAEARELAMAAVAGNLRQIKLGIAERLWLARQLGADDVTASATHLDAARAEHDRLSAVVGGGTDLHIVEGGQPDISGAPETPGGAA
ncbi:MAG: hypothetical protein IIC92_08710 [Chloroflexi bacterium]|nr:hypothetical protein [Chloroflexota bacterium]